MEGTNEHERRLNMVEPCWTHWFWKEPSIHGELWKEGLIAIFVGYMMLSDIIHGRLVSVESLNIPKYTTVLPIPN